MLLDGEAAHVAPRREHNPFAPVRRNALHCYGVDFLSNKEVLEVFSAYAAQQVEWLDDSSCNVLFGDEEAGTRALEELAGPPEDGQPPPEHWTLSKQLSVGQGSKGRQRPREFRLELRMATEADRKDPGHSGHTDSVYYAHVKEQQALQRQAAELRQNKKRMRRSRIPSVGPAARTAAAPAAAEGEAGAVAPDCDTAAPDATDATVRAGGPDTNASAAATTAPRLGCRGPLDPLLYLRAGGNGAGADADALDDYWADGAGSKAGGAEQAQRKSEDLLSALRRAEAEYVAVLPGSEAMVAKEKESERGRERTKPNTRSSGGGRGPQTTPGRGRRRTPGGGGGGRERTPGTNDVKGRTPPPSSAGNRERERTPGKNGQQRRAPPRASQEADEEQRQRGKKRRPVEQEPRAVSNVGPAPRKVAALPEVEAFLSEHRVRCQKFRLKQSFRGIKFGQTKKPKAPAGGKEAGADVAMPAAQAGDAQVPARGKEAGADVAMPAAQAGDAQVSLAANTDATPAAKQTAVPAVDGKNAELPPWERYMEANHHFTKQGQFMHTVAWTVDGRNVLTVIPHPTRVDLDKLARAVEKPRSAIQQCKLKDIQKQTGWPVFVCPPIGHPKDSAGRLPLLLVDSSAVELKRPLLFDCGTVGLSLPVSEFLRSTGAACVEGLGRIMPSPSPTPLPVSEFLRSTGVACVEGPGRTTPSPTAAAVPHPPAGEETLGKSEPPATAVAPPAAGAEMLVSHECGAAES